MKYSKKRTARSRLPLLFLLSTLSVATLPSACSKREDVLRNCDVPALFQSSCDGSGCHGAESNAASLDLVSPGVAQRLFHIPGTKSCNEQKLIVPGRPEDSLLYLKVTADKPTCGAKMPVGRDLSGSEIACLKDYIQRAGTDTDAQKCETCDTILCVDFDRDARHCGGCDQPCGAGMICGAGTCLNPCAENELLCGASCVVIEGDSDNCGACGHRCGPGSTCSNGACTCASTNSGAGGNGGSSSAPEAPSFRDDILPILSSSCSGSSCHTGDERSAPLALDPDKAYAQILQVKSESCGTKSFIVPNNPDKSYLIDKLMGGDLCDGGQMPLGQKELPGASIQTFVNWICTGAPDN